MLNNEVFRANDISLQVENDISLVAERSTVPANFSKTSWSLQETLRCVLPASSENFINGRKSYLKFKVSVGDLGGAYNAGFGVGSALNLFRSAWAQPSSGSEACRVDRLGLHQTSTLPYRASLDWFKTVGSAVGYGMSSTGAGNVIGDWGVQQKIPTEEVSEFTIPLSLLMPCFDCEKLLPPTLVSGMTLNWSMEQAAIAMVFSNDLATTTNVTIESPEIYLDCYRFNDGTTNVLRQVASKDGLFNQFSAWRHQPLNANTTALTITSQQQLTNVTGVFLKSRTTASQVLDADSYASLPNTTTEATQAPAAGFSGYSLQVGSNVYPKQPVRGDQSLIYRNTINAYSGDYFHHPSAVSYNRVTGADNVVAGTWNVGHGLIAIDLRKSDSIPDSGLALVNGETLQCNVDFATAVASVHDMFICHEQYAMSNAKGVKSLI